MPRIDAHHHLWRYNAEEFGWLDGPLTALRRDFLLQDLREATQTAGVTGAVAVQARQSMEETDALLALAAGDSLLLGVVGWLPLRAAGFPTLLEHYAQAGKLRGLRHVVQGEPDGFMDAPEFRRGLGLLAPAGLVYDILIYERQLEEATRLVDSFPEQVFVLDHIAKPRIAAGEREPWATRIRALARRPNVFCKLSGMVTEADPLHWTPEELAPYVDTVLEAFTPARVMVGTDWPVLLAGCSYERWWQLAEGWTSTLSATEQARVLGETAMAAYKLEASKGEQA